MQMAVVDSLPVRHVQDFRELDDEAGRDIPGERLRPFAPPLRQRHTGTKRADEDAHRTAAAHVAYLRDARMTERLQRLGLLQEDGPGLRIRAHVRPEDLQD